MSKLFGKNLLKTKFEGEKNKIMSFGLRVRYLKSSDEFEFLGYRPNMEKLEKELGDGLTFQDLGERKSAKHIIKVPHNVLEAMTKADHVDDIVYSWSIGYQTKRKLGSGTGVFSEMKVLCDRERAFIVSSCGEEANQLLSYEDYEDLSMWQYVFCLSIGFMTEVMRQWKRSKWGRCGGICGGRHRGSWVQAKEREESLGRKLGSVNEKSNEKVDDDVLERANHNMKVAVQKGIYAWYLEAYKEKCQALGNKFDKEQCRFSWENESGRNQK